MSDYIDLAQSLGLVFNGFKNGEAVLIGTKAQWDKLEEVLTLKPEIIQ